MNWILVNRLVDFVSKLYPFLSREASSFFTCVVTWWRARTWVRVENWKKWSCRAILPYRESNCDTVHYCTLQYRASRVWISWHFKCGKLIQMIINFDESSIVLLGTHGRKNNIEILFKNRDLKTINKFIFKKIHIWFVSDLDELGKCLINNGEENKRESCWFNYSFEFVYKVVNKVTFEKRFHCARVSPRWLHFAA